MDFDLTDEQRDIQKAAKEFAEGEFDRELALKLQINPNTIIKIYSQLEVEGYIYSRPGSGYFVQYDKEKLKQERYELFEEETQDYISKVIELGYSFDDILEIMKRYFNRDNLSTNDSTTENTGGSNDRN